MKFSLKNARKFGWQGLNGWAYNSKEEFPNASGAYFEVTGRHGKIKTLSSDRIYFIIEGKGEFTIDGVLYAVEPQDVIIVTKNVEYDYRAIRGTTLKMFLVHAPAYDSNAEILLEKIEQ